MGNTGAGKGKPQNLVQNQQEMGKKKFKNPKKCQKLQCLGKAQILLLGWVCAQDAKVLRMSRK